MDHKVSFPSNSEFYSCDSVIEDFIKTNSPDCSDNVFIDLSNLDFIRPYGLTLLACTIYDLLMRLRNVRLISPKEAQINKYLEDIGFYKEFKIGSSQNILVSPRSTSIVLKRLDRLNMSYIESLIHWLGRDLTLSKGIKDLLNESIIEIITNALDHSSCPFGCYICAQTYPKLKEMELSIMDFGFGIPHNLRPVYPHLRNDAEAVKYSTLEGVSSRKGKGAKGTGLSTLKELIIINEGQMRIFSSQGRYELTKKKESCTPSAIPFPGTCVNLNIRIDDKRYFVSDEEESNIFNY